MIFGPTFAEMRDPGLVDPALREKAREARSRPLDPLNLWNLSWKADGAVPFTVLPEALTGVRAPIVVLSGRHFPTGSHKVGPAYSILVEKQLDGALRAGRAHARLPLDRQLRDRRRLGRPAHGLPLARGAARGDERRALREDPRLRGGRDRDPGQRVERQGDLRQGPRAARRSPEPDPEPVRGDRELPLPLPLHRGRGPGGRGRARARSGRLRLGHGLGGDDRGGRGPAPESPRRARRGGGADAVPDAAQRGLRRPPHRGDRRQARDLDPQRVGHRPARLRRRPRVPGGPAAPAGGAGDARGGGRRRRSARGAGSASSASAASATSSPRSARPTTTASGRGRRS